MKKPYLIAMLMFLVTAWGIGFFLLQATAIIHTLAWLAVLVLIHGILKGELVTSAIEPEEQQVNS